MTSRSLTGLLEGVDEVRALRTHYPVPHHGIATGSKAVAAKAHGRACVVLLSSHLERYIHASNEEAVDWLNSQACSLRRFPEEFLLLHSRTPVQELAQRDWLKRRDALREFVATQASIWSATGATGQLQHGQLLEWMKSPKPEALSRFYRLYGVENIFASVTRTPRTRGMLYLGIRELVEKRNNIAHGDAQPKHFPSTSLVTCRLLIGSPSRRIASWLAHFENWPAWAWHRGDDL